MRERFQERQVVAILEEDPLPGVAPIQDMIALVANRGSCSARHARIVLQQPGGEQEKTST
jgi:hypothetical protein